MPQIRPLGPHTGGEITGVDVKRLDEESFAPIYQAWLKYGVVVVRDQQLEIEDFIRYSRRFGRVVPHPSKSTRHPDHPEITLLGIDKFGPDGKLNEAIYRRGAGGWHTDGAYDEVPSRPPSFTRWRCRAAAAIHTSPACTWPMTPCQSG